MTPIFSKVYVSFVVAWLKDRIHEKIDPRQFGNMPNTSCHYLICHNILVKKLLGLGVHLFPVRLIASFLSDRCQRTKHK